MGRRSFVWVPAAIAATGLFMAASDTRDEGRMPNLDVVPGWLNSAPLNSKALRGKVVLVNFWTYSCINSLRELPYMKAWAEKYGDKGLVVVGVHTPEFGFEKEQPNVRTAVSALKIAYPIAVDSDHAIWNSFRNEYWPADYIIDGKGRIRYHHFGEGEYERAERVIQTLLRENGATGLDESLVQISATGPEAPPSRAIGSPETYVGYARAENFVSPERLARDGRRIYSLPAHLDLNKWGFSGAWNAGPERSTLEVAPGKIVFRFHGRDLHMVLGPSKDGAPVRFRVRLNGVPPGEHHGSDSAADGSGVIREPRMYQLIRQTGPIEDAVFVIEFLDRGAAAYSFTFG
ncbi:redoxin domain-containing protein [Paludibaculum fermentans]|uniref:Redoxin domain-containing protein n=1 Tax=Paludibaculum fermentans TaxID=1473598 RepID=A0A7S7NN46_PALFE|nr:redoxin domain-containing protein [Paludibaculum fermentans]QOY86580.1 redoxin domain-containing protein [Paludibaculum fermentans]